jgi:TetR/AcrR family transcriptional regulator
LSTYRSVNTDSEGSQVERRILAAARLQFAEAGYAATSLRKIAARAAVTKPMVYYYFGSKAGLYHSVVELAFAELRRALEAAAQRSGSARDKLEAVVAAGLTFARAREGVASFASLCTGPQGANPPIDTERFKNLVARVVESVLAVGRREDSIKAIDGVLVAETIFAVLLSPLGRSAGDELAGQVVALLWNGIANLP